MYKGSASFKTSTHNSDLVTATFFSGGEKLESFVWFDRGCCIRKPVQRNQGWKRRWQEYERGWWSSVPHLGPTARAGRLDQV